MVNLRLKPKFGEKSHPKSLKFAQRIGDVKTQRVLKYFCDTIIILSNMTNFSQGGLVPTRGYKSIQSKIQGGAPDFGSMNNILNTDLFKPI